MNLTLVKRSELKDQSLIGRLQTSPKHLYPFPQSFFHLTLQAFSTGCKNLCMSCYLRTKSPRNSTYNKFKFIRELFLITLIFVKKSIREDLEAKSAATTEPNCFKIQQIPILSSAVLEIAKICGCFP